MLTTILCVVAFLAGLYLGPAAEDVLNSITNKN